MRERREARDETRCPSCVELFCLENRNFIVAFLSCSENPAPSRGLDDEEERIAHLRRGSEHVQIRNLHGGILSLDGCHRENFRRSKLILILSCQYLRNFNLIISTVMAHKLILILTISDWQIRWAPKLLTFLESVNPHFVTHLPPENLHIFAP